jgi:hypothetical protein
MLTFHQRKLNRNGGYINNEVDFRAKATTNNKQGHFIVIKYSKKKRNVSKHFWRSDY